VSILNLLKKIPFLPPKKISPLRNGPQILRIKSPLAREKFLRKTLTLKKENG